MKFCSPLKKYLVSGYKFKDPVFDNGIDWGIHLGDDLKADENEKVFSVARGKVVYSDLHAGSKIKGNWGNIIIIEHLVKNKKIYSLYGHLGERFKSVHDIVKTGELIGIIGKSNTQENGHWPAHLHFAIYAGPWTGEVLPGYYKADQKRTELSHWINPQKWLRQK